MAFIAIGNLYVLYVFITPDYHHHFEASGTSNAMFEELAERSLMSPLAGTKHKYVRLTIIMFLKVPPKLEIKDITTPQGRHSQVS